MKEKTQMMEYGATRLERKGSVDSVSAAAMV